MLKTMQVSLQLVFAHPQNCRDLLPHSILRQAKKQTNKQENKTKQISFLSLSLSLSLSQKFREKKEFPTPLNSPPNNIHTNTFQTWKNSAKKKITSTG
jgi:hypothetical protein